MCAVSSFFRALRVAASAAHVAMPGLCGILPSSSSALAAGPPRPSSTNSVPSYRRPAQNTMAAGSQTVQQQALRDFAQAMRNFFGRTHRRPTWRKAGKHEGFRQVGVKPHHIKRLNRRYGQVWIPKVGWVRFRWTRAIAHTVKSYRVTLDRSGRWHIAFAAIPDPISGPGDGSVVGVDRGVAVSVALSSGQLLRAPSLRAGETQRLRRLQHRLARARLGSQRRARTKLAIARLRARETDRRRDWVEKTTTDTARRFDTIRVEDRRCAR